MAREPRAWQRMLSGRRLDLLDPSPLDVELEDIAHGLARVARWNGQTEGPHIFSVAQHSLFVEAIAGHLSPDISGKARLTVLLHDAPEYVIGDIISPFKAVIGDAYKVVEGGLLTAIHLHFGLPAETRTTSTVTTWATVLILLRVLGGKLRIPDARARITAITTISRSRAITRTVIQRGI